MTFRQPTKLQMQWLEKADAESNEENFKRIYNAEPKDFSLSIQSLEFWDRCALAPKPEDIAQLNLILNVYLADTANNPVSLLRPVREAAPALLSKAAKALSNAVKAMNDIKKNPYAVSAVTSEFADNFPESIGDDYRIDDLNRFFGELESLSNIMTRAAKLRSFSDGLPKPSAGHPSDQYFDRAILKLCSLLKNITGRSYLAEHQTQLNENARQLSDSEIARHIVELLAIINRVVEPQTIEDRLYRLRGYFPVN